MANENFKKGQQINRLSIALNHHESAILRKETAAWSFIVFYVAFIWAFYAASTDTLIFSLIVVVLIGYIAFQFVHAQYASIYWMTAHKLATQEKIDHLIQENNEKLKGRQYYLEKKVQPFLRDKHPLKILLRFWLYWLFKFLWEKKGIKEVEKLANPKKYLSNPAKQEASLYSIIILVTLAYCYLISIWLFILLVFFSIWYFFRILKEIIKMDLNQLLDKLVI